MNWQRAALLDVSVLGPQYGANVRAVQSSGGTVRYVRITDIDEWGRLHRKSWVAPESENLDDYLLEDGDILLARSGATVGKSYVYSTDDGPCVFAGYLIRFRLDRRVAEPRYLAYYLQTREYWSWIKAKRRVAAQPNVNGAEYASLPLPIPPLSEQRRIVEILDQADCLRRLRAGADSKAERILPALFISMFGDPATNPKGWRELPLDRVADVQGGLQLSEKRKGSIDVPYLRVANVYRNHLDLSEIKTLSVTQSELDRTRLTAGDVLVVEGHGNPAEIGRCAVWDGSIDPCVHQNHLIRARPDPSQVRPYFLSRFLNSAAGRQHLLRCGKTTSGLNTITVSNVKSAVIFLPPVDLQQRFEEGVTSEDSTRKLRAVASAALERLWKLLLDRAFSGSLTTQWREAHMKELLREVEQQSRALAEVR